MALPTFANYVTLLWTLFDRVVYPLAADNVSRPLPIRLKGVNQPVIRA
jgi:hypothetical protein